MGTVCQTPCLTQGNSDGCETAPALHLPTSRGRSICTQGDVLTPAGCSVVTGVDGQGTGWAALGKMLEFVRAMGSDSETVTTETGRPGAVTDCHVPGVLGDKGGPRRQGLRRRSQDFVAQASLNSSNSTNTCQVPIRAHSREGAEHTKTEEVHLPRGWRRGAL